METTKYILRDYQKDAVNAGVNYFLNKEDNKPAVIVIPTGGGKSLVIAAIAKELDGNVLILQPRKELLEQNYEKYISYGNKAGIYSASCNSRRVSSVTFATIGSIRFVADLFKDFRYCIIDECHLLKPDDTSMYSQFFEKINIKILGLTATPIRLKSYNFPYPHSKLCMLDRQRPRTFKQYIHITQIWELARMDYFSKIRYDVIKFSRNGLRLNTTGADFTDKSMYMELNRQDVNGKISGYVKRLLREGRKHILVFAVSVEDAQIIARDTGGDYVTAKTPKKEREKILLHFKHGIIKTVVNVGVLTVGFDFPELDTIILGRPTMSLALYYQMIGRGVRPAPGKEECLVCDFTGNYDVFGEVENLEIKNVNGWGIFSGNRRITNAEMDKPVNVVECDYVFTIGKHKDKKITEVPNEYLLWIYDNWDRTKYNNENIFSYIEKNIL
jgi:DNA repair protein RadD